MDERRQRLISPALGVPLHLPPRAARGLERVARFFDTHLAPDWEIYLRPHLNGLCPDIILLNPKIGIAVYKVVEHSLEPGSYHLATGDADNKRGMRVRSGAQDEWTHIVDPFSAIRAERHAIADLYAPSLRRLFGQPGLAAVSGGIIFVNATEDRVRQITKEAGYPRNRYSPVVSGEALEEQTIYRVFPESNRRISRLMSDAAADELRVWLREPEYRAANRHPLTFDRAQTQLVTTRTSSGYRRIRGAAGSGKTHVIAGRAARLEAEGKRVLILTYNAALIRYIRDLVDRARHAGSNNERITILGFHAWCKQLCERAGLSAEYRGLWRRHLPEPQASNEDKQRGLAEVLESALPDLTNRAITILNGFAGHSETGYDAVLVDEAQDWLPRWWHIACHAVGKGGEYVLAADVTQDLYGKAHAWTDEAMRGAGMRGPWSELHTSYRLPTDYVEHVTEFGERFVEEEGRRLPSTRELTFDAPTRMRWWQVPGGQVPEHGALAVANLQAFTREDLASYSDVVVLVPTKALGRQVILRLQQLNIYAVHTFQEGSRAASGAKQGFSVGENGVKATTVHSIKGWEARYLVICAERVQSERARRAMYVALSRLKASETGARSYVTVVTSEPELYTYGTTWPEFHDHQHELPSSPHYRGNEHRRFGQSARRNSFKRQSMAASWQL